MGHNQSLFRVEWGQAFYVKESLFFFVEEKGSEGKGGRPGERWMLDSVCEVLKLVKEFKSAASAVEIYCSFQHSVNEGRREFFCVASVSRDFFGQYTLKVVAENGQIFEVMPGERPRGRLVYVRHEGIECSADGDRDMLEADECGH